MNWNFVLKQKYNEYRRICLLKTKYLRQFYLNVYAYRQTCIDRLINHRLPFVQYLFITVRLIKLQL